MSHKLISDERLEGLAIGLRFGLENDKNEIREKLSESLVEISMRKQKK